MYLLLVPYLCTCDTYMIAAGGLGETKLQLCLRLPNPLSLIDKVKVLVPRDPHHATKPMSSTAAESLVEMGFARDQAEKGKAIVTTSNSLAIRSLHHMH